MLKRFSPRGPSRLRSYFLRHLGQFVLPVLGVAIIGGLAWTAYDEFYSSRRQAAYLANYAKRLDYRVESGPSPSIRFPRSGPYDERLGYSQLPELLARLKAKGYAVTQQARVSSSLVKLSDRGLFMPYREKDRSGLELLDAQGRSFYTARFPQRVYADFDAVPPLLATSLSFIEDHDLLDTAHPMRNPAVDWARFGKAVADQARHAIDSAHEAPGGSTLATQIEKYRHSPEGRTASGSDKLKQMGSAALRAYLDGKDTLPARREILVSYLNTVPLSAKAGYGEINGLGDGLWAWYGRDFDEVNRLLQGGNAGQPAITPPDALMRRAEAYKQALSLMVAQRRPSYYLGEGQRDLAELTDSYLRLLAAAGVIPAPLCDAALAVKLTLQRAPNVPSPASFVERKAANAWRTHLAELLGKSSLYELDRLDLSVGTTLNGVVQHAVTNAVREVADPGAAKAHGLYGFRMLSPGDDLDKLTVSITLYERGTGVNLLRAQADNLDQPFDINEGARLNLGSTAKLRTLINYLEIIAALHDQYGAMGAGPLAAVKVAPRDALTRWAIDYLVKAKDRGLRPMLDAAMEREYSGNPGEAFFTGGGLQTFSNFDREENFRKYTVRTGFQHSVNLVFVRLMRDIVRYHIAHTPGSTAQLLDDADNPLRQKYLARFADQEGRAFISRFHKKYQGKTARAMQETLLQGVRPIPRRLAVVFRSIMPDASPEQMVAFLRGELPPGAHSDAELRELYAKFGPERFSLADRGYIAGVHPLELWLVGYLMHHPDATRAQIVAASENERQAVYQWLFRTRHKNAQDNRIQSLLEVEAFLEIAKDWRRLGYPFESLTPSYATAVGASGDRPAALAELMGIIVNKGIRLPLAKVSSLRFAAGTPYETRLDYRPSAPEPVLPEEIAEIVRRSLVGVVEGGTAVRLAGGLALPDGRKLEVGGKTGTGEQLFETYGRRGETLSSRVVNRSATFVFLLGDRWFGTITIYAHEPDAARYKFTSALSVQLLKSLGSALLPLFENAGTAQIALARPVRTAPPRAGRSERERAD